MTMMALPAEDLSRYFLFWKDVKTITGSSEATIRRAINKE